MTTKEIIKKNKLQKLKKKYNSWRKKKSLKNKGIDPESVYNSYNLYLAFDKISKTKDFNNLKSFDKQVKLIERIAFTDSTNDQETIAELLELLDLDTLNQSLSILEAYGIQFPNAYDISTCKRKVEKLVLIKTKIAIRENLIDVKINDTQIKSKTSGKEINNSDFSYSLGALVDNKDNLNEIIKDYTEEEKDTLKSNLSHTIKFYSEAAYANLPKGQEPDKELIAELNKFRKILNILNVLQSEAAEIDIQHISEANTNSVSSVMPDSGNSTAQIKQEETHTSNEDNKTLEGVNASSQNNDDSQRISPDKSIASQEQTNSDSLQGSKLVERISSSSSADEDSTIYNTIRRSDTSIKSETSEGEGFLAEIILDDDNSISTQSVYDLSQTKSHKLEEDEALIQGKYDEIDNTILDVLDSKEATDSISVAKGIKALQKKLESIKKNSTSSDKVLKDYASNSLIPIEKIKELDEVIHNNKGQYIHALNNLKNNASSKETNAKRSEYRKHIKFLEGIQKDIRTVKEFRETKNKQTIALIEEANSQLSLMVEKQKKPEKKQPWLKKIKSFFKAPKKRKGVTVNSPTTSLRADDPIHFTVTGNSSIVPPGRKFLNAKNNTAQKNRKRPK
jgi:hypothetical protein